MDGMYYSYLAVLSTIYVTCISCWSRDWYNIRIHRPCIENAAGARTYGNFGQNISFTRIEDYLLYLKSADTILCCLFSTCKNSYFTEKYTSRLYIGIIFKNII